MFKPRMTRRALLGTTACLMAMSMNGTALAQANDDEEAEELSVEEVVVTGSRIRRSGFDTTAPVITIDSGDIAARNFTNAADILNETPAFGAPAANPVGTQGGFAIGQNVLNLFGLGSNRTLTVVNGRRFVTNNPPVPGGSSTASGLQVDYNVIPVSLIERIETLPLDGAPVYGSDGIAGVVNVILKDDYEGFEVQGQFGISEAGDGESYQFQTVFGGNFADGRGNAVLSVEYNRQTGLRGIDRPNFRENNPFSQRDPATGEVVLYNTDRAGRGLITSLIGDFGAVSINTGAFIPAAQLGTLPGTTESFEFDEAGNLIPFQAGTLIPGQSPIFANGGSGSDLFDQTEQILTDSERVNIGGLAHYDVFDGVRAFAEVIVQNATATESSQQDDILSGVFGGDQLAPIFSVDNPLLTAQARQTLIDNGVSTFGVQRFLGPIVGGGENDNESWTWRLVGGLEGDFEMADRSFNWEVSANFGQSDLETRNTTVITDRLINSLNVRALTQEDIDDFGQAAFNDITAIREGETVRLADNAIAGDVVCQGLFDIATGNPPESLSVGDEPGTLFNDERRFIEGCIPLNIFGNQFAPAAADWVSGVGINSTDVQQRVFEAILSTAELFELPGGDVGASISYTNRKETARFQPGGFQELALGQGDPTPAGGGSFSTDEFAGELSIPIIGEDMIPFVNRLSFEPKARYVDNSVAGGDWTYTLGGRFEIFDFVSFRGGYTRSIRSPGLQELFDPNIGTRGFVADPCDNRNVGAGPNDNRRINCEAIGIDTATFVSGAVNASIAGESVGNPDLTNEKGDSYSIGVVLQPYDFIPGLDIAVDYINIEIKDRISNITQNAAAAACYDADPADFPQPICNAIVRAPSGQITLFRRSFQNASTSKFEGVQVNTRYQFDIADAVGLVNSDWGDTDYGQFEFSVNAFRNITQILQVTDANEIINTVGEFGEEKWNANFDFEWLYGDFRAFWRMNFTSGIDLDVQDRDTFIFRDLDGNVIESLGDRWIHNLTLSYNLTENLTASATINNIFERKGDILERALLDGGSPFGIDGVRGFDELFGRSFRFRLRATF